MIYKSPFPDVAIPDVSLVDYVFRDLAKWPDKPAMTDGPSGRSYTYKQLHGAIKGFGAGLYARGLRKGDVIGIVSPNIPEFAIAFLGAASIGAVASTVNPLSTAEEIATQFTDSKARLLITIPLFLDKCREAAKIAGAEEVFVFGEAPGATPFASLIRPDLPLPVVTIHPREDLACLPYSSGTSGIPKGVMLTHYNLVANMEQSFASAIEVRPDDVVLGVLPFFHIYGMVVIMMAVLVNGGTIVTMPKFELEPFLQLIQQYKVTLVNVVPPIVLALAKHPVVEKYDLSSLRLIGSGAAPLGAPLAGACEARIKVKVRQGYGLTETSPVTHFHPQTGTIVKHESIGPLVSNTEARIVDPETGADVPAGAPGELWLRGPQVMKGYFNKPEATALCMAPDGWFKTGDVATVDDTGWFRIVDRVKELIKYKGMQIAPAELEAILLHHPAVADAAVIPVADEEAGEIPKAFVVLKSPIDTETLMAFVAEHVAPYKKVRRMEVVDNIPKSPSGKILRRFLVELERSRAAT